MEVTITLSTDQDESGAGVSAQMDSIVSNDQDPIGTGGRVREGLHVPAIEINNLKRLKGH